MKLDKELASCFFLSFFPVLLPSLMSELKLNRLRCFLPAYFGAIFCKFLSLSCFSLHVYFLGADAR